VGRRDPDHRITGWGQAEDRQRSKDAGFDGHLVKPVVLAELTALLEGSLR
jgi:CheY-like chemotaxis protein